MTVPKEPTSLLVKCTDQQVQFNATCLQLSEELTLGAINRFKAQVLVLSDWLFGLNAANSDLVLARALTHSTDYIPHSNQAFCAGIITAKFCHRLHLHGQHAKLLISSALTMNVSLLLNGLSTHIYQQKKLTSQQIKQYQHYPMSSAQLLSKYHIIDKSILSDILSHRENLDGSGMPTKLSQHKISRNSRLLGIVSRFIDLTAAKHNRSGYKIKQALAYLVQHQQQFDMSLLNQLINLVDKPLPSFIYKLNKTQYALINHSDQYAGVMSCVAFSIEQGQLHLKKDSEQHPIDIQKIYLTPPSVISSRLLAEHLEEYVDEPLEDISDQTQRLKPSDDLSLLLHELDAHLPNKSLISELISQQPVVGDRLIKYLQNNYPSSHFNSSYHAMQMAGFNQVKPLLSRLALNEQLSHFQFSNAFELQQKVNCCIALSAEIANECQHVLPNQLAMFTLLNLAPLYLESRVINGKKNEPVSLKKCHVYHGYSLVGLNNSQKQPKISMALAKIWAPQKTIINALSAIDKPELKRPPQERELIAGFELSIYLTHTVFNSLSLKNALNESKVIAICRELKLTKDKVLRLQQLSLCHQPMCEL